MFQFGGMLTIYNCITVEHDLSLVILAGLICLFASLSAVSLLAHAAEAGPERRALWILGAGVVAGCGIWATHFIAMLAFRPDEPVNYAPGLTFASLIIALVLSTAGLYIAARVRPAGVGGAVLGLAIGAMHYVGMAAVTLHGHLVWDRDFVITSIILGVVLGAASLQALFAIPDIKGRIVGATLLTLAICTLHFTGMAAVSIVPDPSIPLVESAVDAHSLAISVAAITALIVALAFVGSVVDRHLAGRSVKEAERLRAYVAELEDTKEKLEVTSRELLVALGAAASADQAKSQFLATMSHELRTPLNAILGFSEIMAYETFGPLGSTRYKDYADDILKSGQHLLSLINDVLDFTRADAGALLLTDENIDVAEAIADAARMIEAQAASGSVALHIEADETLPHIRADHRRIRQVLLNLLSNAVKFTPPGGNVHITTAIDDQSLVIRVIDTGIGIAVEDIPTALERFGQIDSDLARKYEGTGLGLPLSKCLMEHHGGTLEIDSEPGRGTTVSVRFPGERILPYPASSQEAFHAAR
jgi:signal transduction histidine kinase